MAVITVSRLRVGQRFSWIPAAWYGPTKLIMKRRCWREDAYDLKFDAAVINPPGIEYGVPGGTRVRLLKPKK